MSTANLAHEEHHEEGDEAPGVDEERIVPLYLDQPADHDLSYHVHTVLSRDRPAHGVDAQLLIFDQLEAHRDADALHETVAYAERETAEEHYHYAVFAEQRGHYTAHRVHADAYDYHRTQRHLAVDQKPRYQREYYRAEVRDVVYESYDGVGHIREGARNVCERGRAPLSSACGRVCEQQYDYANYRAPFCCFIHCYTSYILSET